MESPERRFLPLEQFYSIKGQLLGTGKYSVVKTAVSKETGEVFAAKMIEKKKVSNKKELEQEIEMLRVLNHPSIIKLFDVFETSTHLFLVTELCTGGELFDKIVERQSYTEKDAAMLLKEILNVVVYLHKRKIVHRDLKPENLLYSSENEKDAVIKVVDFGFACYVKDNEKLITMCGTPGYMAPEIRTGGGYGLEVDMFSVGVILYILLCGFPPFEDDDSCDFDFPSPEWDHISYAAKDLIENLITRDPKNRLTVQETLVHPWINTAEMRKFNTTRHTGQTYRHRQIPSLFSVFSVDWKRSQSLSPNSAHPPANQSPQSHDSSSSESSYVAEEMRKQSLESAESNEMWENSPKEKMNLSDFGVESPEINEDFLNNELNERERTYPLGEGVEDLQEEVRSLIASLRGKSMEDVAEFLSEKNKRDDEEDSEVDYLSKVLDSLSKKLKVAQKEIKKRNASIEVLNEKVDFLERERHAKELLLQQTLQDNRNKDEWIKKLEKVVQDVKMDENSKGNQLKQLRKEYFFTLAGQIKLGVILRGGKCAEVGGFETLWEKSLEEHLDHSKWPEWILRQFIS